MQSQEELLIEVTVSALGHWVKSGKKPANLPANEVNSLYITSAIMNSIKQTGRKPTVDEVDAIVKGLGDLASGGKLYYSGATAAEKAEAEKKAKREKFNVAHNAGLLNSAKHNKTELDDEWNRGKSRPLPLSESEVIAINAKNSRINEVLGETLTSINRYSAGKNHARTQSRREELSALFNQRKIKVDSVAQAEQLAKDVDAKIDSYDKSSGGIS